MEELKPEELADQIMRWDWRDMFREGNKKAIREMFEAYGEQVKNNLVKPDVIKSVCDHDVRNFKDRQECEKCPEVWIRQ